MKSRKLLGVVFLLISQIFLFCFTASAETFGLMSQDASDWISVDAASFGKVSKATVAISDEGWKFGNTAGLWPYMQHSLKKVIRFNTQSDKIRYDFTPNVRTSLRVIFTDKSGASQSVVINSAVTGAAIDKDTGEIKASSEPLTGELKLGDLSVKIKNGEGYEYQDIAALADEKGNIEITGVCVSVFGSSQNTVDIRELSVLTPYQPQSTSETNKTNETTSQNNPVDGKQTNKVSTGMSQSNATEAMTANLNTDQKEPGGETCYDTAAKDGDMSGTVFITGVSITIEAVSNLETGKANPALAAVQNVNSGYSGGSGSMIVVIMLSVGCAILLAAYILFFRKKPDDHR